MAQTIMYIIPLLGIVGLLFTYFKSNWVEKQDAGTEKMQIIAKAISEGAMAFLKAEYKILVWFVLAVAILMALGGSGNTGSSWIAGLSFVIGAFCSVLAGYIGMKVATKSNVRTTAAARTSLNKALEVAFSGGSVMGMGVVGLGVLGLGSLFLIYNNMGWDINKVITVITGFSFGASSIALFARVGGGIYTKAADVGADLVGKVEAGIPEDHPLNPATIADNVGDNVGDVAGMGADLFESYVGSIIGTMVLGATYIGIAGYESSNEFNGLNAVLLPLVLSGVGILTSILGTFFVKTKEGGDPQKALNLGVNLSSVIMLGLALVITQWMLPSAWEFQGLHYTNWGVFWAVCIGLVSGVAIGYVTEYYTGTGGKPVRSIVNQSMTGTATNIIAGLGVGMQSTAIPTIILAAAIMGSYHFAGLYGIAIAAVTLDAVGNTTAAIGKGFAIASAALTALALFAAFMSSAKMNSIDISKPMVMSGLLLGAMLPFLFSSMAMNAVGKAAMEMIQEVRRQFSEIPALKAALAVMKKNDGVEHDDWSAADKHVFEEANGKAEYAKCVEISTKAAVRQMMLPGLLAVASPIFIGFVFGKEMLGGLLAGVTVTGVLMAIFQSNAGGAWDNAKKLFEGGVEIQGKTYYKGSDPHKAAVVGDTVGDPFKDTSGPSLNILLKLISVIALVIAPFL